MMFENVTWGISVVDLLKGVFDYIMLFKEFVILALAIMLAGIIVRFFYLYVDFNNFKEEAMGYRRRLPPDDPYHLTPKSTRSYYHSWKDERRRIKKRRKYS